ncbi:MAG: DUF1697 domain-containing protein [Vicinamibacterales bacterium]
MAIVAFLRGVNVGGHRTFRPAALARDLEHLGAVNIGAAGTFVFRSAMTSAELRAELTRRLPFEADMAICRGRDVARLIARDPFAEELVQQDVIRFVNVLCGRLRREPDLPLSIPSDGEWVLQVLGRQGRFVFGRYRRRMKAIAHLATVDTLFGIPSTNRSWTTILAVGRALGSCPYSGR